MCRFDFIAVLFHLEYFTYSFGHHYLQQTANVAKGFVEYETFGQTLWQAFTVLSGCE